MQAQAPVAVPRHLHPSTDPRRRTVLYCTCNCIALSFCRLGAVLHVSAEGAPLQLLLDEDGRHVSHISCVTPAPGGRLYLGNVHGDYISYVDVAGL